MSSAMTSLVRRNFRILMNCWEYVAVRRIFPEQAEYLQWDFDTREEQAILYLHRHGSGMNQNPTNSYSTTLLRSLRCAVTRRRHQQALAKKYCVQLFLLRRTFLDLQQDYEPIFWQTMLGD